MLSKIGSHSFLGLRPTAVHHVWLCLDLKEEHDDIEDFISECVKANGNLKHIKVTVHHDDNPGATSPSDRPTLSSNNLILL